MTPQACADPPVLLITVQPFLRAYASAPWIALLGWRSPTVWTFYNRRVPAERPAHVPPAELGHLVTWDSSPGMGGFGVRVAASGQASFPVRYGNEGRRGRMAGSGEDRANAAQQVTTGVLPSIVGKQIRP